MGKKKSGNKRKDDYWDEEFEQDAQLTGAAHASDSEEDYETFAKRSAAFDVLANMGGDDDDDDGLMAMVNRAAKNKVKKNKKKAKAQAESEPEEVEEEPAQQEEEEPAPAAAEPADEEDELDWVNDRKKNKKNKKQAKATSAPAPEPKDEEETPRLLTKKEKERLKKERQREAKRLANLEKKKKEQEEAAELDKILGIDEKKADVEEEPTQQSKSKSKKKKKAQKQQAEEEPAPPTEEPEPTPTPAPAPAPTSGGKKKKGPAVAALRKMLEAQKAAEEEARRKAEEERKRIEEEKRREEEELARIEEAKRLKKEKQKAKIEQLKKEGKYLTKAQKEAQRRAQLRHQQMLESGAVKIAAFEEQKEKEKEKAAGEKTKIIHENRRKRRNPREEEEARRKKEEEERKKREEEERKRKEEEEAKKKQEESDEEDDWEKAALSSDEEPAPAKTQEKVKDDWEDQTEEEEEEEDQQPKKQPAAGKPAAKAAAAESEESESEEESDSETDSDDSDESSEEELSATQRAALKKKQEAAARRIQRQKDAMAARSKDDLRSPICCILGHVDTGKTKLLDKIRQTNVQEGEAGGITQQIGATYFPAEAIEKKTAVLGKDRVEQLKVPGLLVIDTPGHESFTNLRSRGSSLCNIAILVVDIMHGLEPQTLESIRLLRDRKTPFIVALNKIDRLFQWNPTPDNSFQASLAKQKKSVKQEFEQRVEKTILAFAEQGLNAALYYKNPNFAKYVSLVPTSAITGEGIPDMLNLLVNLTQTRMSDKLMYVSELECTVLEVKVIEGHGTTIDVVLVNGWLHEGDKIVVCGLNGPIVTQIRALLTPQPLRELRVKSQYVHHKSVKAALGVKIAAPDLEKAIAGSRLLVVGPDDDEEDLKEEVMSDLTNLMGSIDRTGHGVWVQASTLGSLEALLEFLRVSKIPVSGINIGPVHKKDVVKASVMLEKAREYAVMLCFDVKVEKEAEDLAEELGMKIFKADIIYHLFDRFVEYNQAMMEQKRKDQAPQAVFPCVLKMVPRAIFNKKDPIIMGVDVIEGTLRLGTPICVVRQNAETKAREVITLGKVTSMEQNHKPVEVVKKGGAGAGVAIKIESAVYESSKTYGRHFDENDEFYSRITRQSIDVLKESFRNDLSKEEWALVVKLKKILGID